MPVKLKFVAVLFFLLSLQLGVVWYYTHHNTHKHSSEGSSGILSVGKRVNGTITLTYSYDGFLDNKWKASEVVIESPMVGFKVRHSADAETNSVPANAQRSHASLLTKGKSDFSHTTLRTWKEGTFCDDFLTNTFQLKIPACSISNQSHLPESVECFGSPHSHSMGTCTLRNIVVSPGVLMRVMYDPDRPKFEENEHSFALLNGMDTECRDMTINTLATRVEGGDYVLKVVKSILKEKAQNVSVCNTWINETVFFFTAHRFHIYFRFLDYFNVHKLVGEMYRRGTITDGFRIIRISGSDNYHFPEFDQGLFPEARVQALEDLADTKTCFEKVILVPKSYASTIFQCKSRVSLRMKCITCDGKGLNETDISKFSDRVLRTCSSRAQSKDKNKLVVLVSRRPYLRNGNDKLNHFERVLDNEGELSRALQQALVNVTVQIVHLENLSLCEQISYGHNADVYLGVHGSGLVHLWWMRDDALLYEMEPHYQIGNPTFRLLSRLSGHNYHSEFVSGGFKTVHSNVRSVVENIKKLSNL